MQTPMDKIREEFTLPFEPHDFQEEALDEMAAMDCSLLSFNVGLGKTVCSTMAALYYSLQEGVEQILVLCPPVLLDQWYEFLNCVKGIPSVLLYRGTPKERERMDIEGHAVVLVSYNIFRGKNDYKRFTKMAKNSKLCIIADELSLKNLQSQTYRKLKEVLYRKMRLKWEDEPYHKLIALNATPLSSLEQVYNWCSLFKPGLYGSKRLFEYAHVAEQDHWGKVTEWRKVDLLRENMDLFSVNTRKTIKLPELVESVVPYTLSKKHMKLYEEVKESHLANLPPDKIELALNSMFSTLQRLVLVPKEYGLDIDSPVLDYIHGYLDQLQPEDGILIYSRHVAVSELLAENIPDSVAIYGGVSKKVREKGFEDLKSGKITRLIGNLDSLGVGLNLQMLNHVIFAELPFRDDKRTQSMGRLHRQGQDKTCFASFPLAKKTLQEQIYHRLLKNGEDLGKVIKTKEQAAEFLS